MKNKISENNPTLKGRTLVAVKDLKPKDVVFISPTSKTRYLVLDVGHPMILLENLTSHWASLYHPIDGLYKESDFFVSPKN